ncbi:Integrase OS=Streptomyces aurantiogriseus OX=66870 GN=GCM10010251_26280 PE=4 SV=1 [Streptomyces aurantiogriseus]
MLQWVAKASRPLIGLHDPVLARDVLESLRRKLDGGQAAVETMRRKRKVLVHALHYVVERGELGSHPLEKIRWRVPKPSVSVDPRAVANPYGARELLSAVSYVGGYRRGRGRRLVGFFAGMYYAGLRPEEAVAAALPDCRLPRAGWGRLILHRRPRFGRPGQRLHQPQHQLHDLESDAPGGPAQTRRRPPGLRQPALGVGRRPPTGGGQPRTPLNATVRRKDSVITCGVWDGCPFR